MRLTAPVNHPKSPASSVRIAASSWKRTVWNPLASRANILVPRTTIRVEGNVIGKVEGVRGEQHEAGRSDVSKGAVVDLESTGSADHNYSPLVMKDVVVPCIPSLQPAHSRLRQEGCDCSFILAM
jgi:hypothetical protein